MLLLLTQVEAGEVVVVDEEGEGEDVDLFVGIRKGVMVQSQS